MDVYFFTRLVHQEEFLPYPLPAGWVDIRRWVVAHYGPNPIEDGCVSKPSILDLMEQMNLSMIMHLVCLVALHQVSRPRVIVLLRLQAGNFF